MNTPGTRVVQIIRHGEKPPDSPPPFGIDLDGNQDVHSLTPLGWQRAGGLAALFAPFEGVPRTGLATPSKLCSPGYGSLAQTALHRTYQTLLPLSQWLGLDIDTSYTEGEEARLGADLAAVRAGVALVCWEHTAIAEIAKNITPMANVAEVPEVWPSERFDVVYTVTWDETPAAYRFDQVSQMLLAGDVDEPISIETATGTGA
jgi:hypothetical protein